VDQDIAYEAIGRITSDQELYDSFSQNIAFRPVQTTIPNRSLGPRLVLMAHQKRFKKPINMVSIGHGLGLNEKKLLLNDPFPRTRVRQWEDPRAGIMRENSTLSDRLGEKLLTPIDFETIYAMDILPADKDPASEEWVMSCFTPDEQMDEWLMASVDRLRFAKPSNYYSLQGDFAEYPKSDIGSDLPENIDLLLQEMGGKKADIVVFSTLWYMLPPYDRAAMWNNALNILNHNGLIVVQDNVMRRHFTQHMENPLAQLHFPAEWGAWTYRDIVFDPDNTGFEFEEAMAFENGRCGAVRFSDKYLDMLFQGG
jgi:hypothetical protein